MRRPCLTALAIGLAASAGAARATPWGLSAEAGAEYDTNVERVETGPGLDTAPIASGVLRLGVRADHKGDVAGGHYALALSDLTRVVSTGTAEIEDVTLLAGDVRWLHPVGDRPVSLGFGLTAADSQAIADTVGARTFVNLGGDLLLQLRDTDDRRLTLAVGGRHFEYKPDEEYDWDGPTANARLDVTLYHSDDRTRSLELATLLAFEARMYGSAALGKCAPGQPPDCVVATEISRADRYQRAGIELTYVGRQVLSLGYDVSVVDSNSYGQSLVRHRVTASATTSLPHKLYFTAIAILQIDDYLDGLVLQQDLQHTSFTSLDDENRSSIQLRLARALTPAWSIEVRAAAWRNIAGDTMDLAFHRELVSLGVVYNK